MIKVYTDGASLGNPGRVGIGYVIYEDEKIIAEKGFFLGVQSNNFAEYMALIFALTELVGRGERSCQAFCDSELLCEQIKGNYKVKNQNIFPLFILVKELIGKFDNFTITHVRREYNALADKLAKKAAESLA